jgi:hypothetical protein
VASPAKRLAPWIFLTALFFAVWFLFGAPSGGAVATETSWSTPLAILGAVVALVLGFRSLVAAAKGHNQAIADANVHVAAGRFDEAIERVQGLGRSRLPQFRRMLPAWLATLEMARGDARASAAAATAAIDMPIAPFFRDSQRSTANVARAFRAFARACAGDAEGAREDIAHLRATQNEGAADASQLARASLAEARLLDEAGDRAGLADLLARDRTLLLDATLPRERALVRAYEAMLDATTASVYRRKAEHGSLDDDAVATAAWIAKMAPNAAPFVRPSVPAGKAAEAPPEVPSEAARRKVLGSKPASVKGEKTWWVAIWVVVVIAALLAWGRADRTPWAGLAHAAIAVVGAALVGAFLVTRVRRSTRNTRRIADAHRAIVRGDLPTRAEDIGLEAPTPAQRAQIECMLAEAALRRGEPERALEHVARGFEALAIAQGGKVLPPAAPAEGAPVPWDLQRALAAVRACALAARGRADEAWAEIEWANGLPANNPTVFRVRLLTRLRARDFDGAARAVEGRAAPLGARDEALAEIARFLGRPAERTRGAADRFRAELRRDPGLAPWVEALAPGVMAAFEVALAESAAGPAEEARAEA